MAYAVITRELDAAAPYAAALAALGLEAIALPVTMSAPAGDPDELARAVAGGGYAAIVIASARAAAALAAARGDAPIDGEVWAVGPATARALAAAGIAARVPPDARDAHGLAQAMLAARELAGRRVLVPRAEGGRDEAIAALRAAGAEVDAIVAYRTVPTPAGDPGLAAGLAALRDRRAAVCAVFAPSQVAALDALVAIGSVAAPFAAIGETTAAALRAAGAGLVVVSDGPTPERLAKAVSAVYPLRT